MKQEEAIYSLDEYLEKIVTSKGTDSKICYYCGIAVTNLYDHLKRGSHVFACLEPHCYFKSTTIPSMKHHLFMHYCKRAFPM